MSASDTGESVAAAGRRHDDRVWPDIKNALLAGAVLRRPSGMKGFYTEGLPMPDARNGRCLYAAGVKRREKSGELVRVGVDTYGLGGTL